MLNRLFCLKLFYIVCNQLPMLIRLMYKIGLIKKRKIMKKLFSLLMAISMLSPMMTYAKSDSSKVSVGFISSKVTTIDKDGNVKTVESTKSLDEALGQIDSVLKVNGINTKNSGVSIDGMINSNLNGAMDLAIKATVVSVIFVLFLLLVVMAFVIWRTNSRNKLIRDALAAGKDIPIELIKPNLQQRGIKNTALGVGLGLFFGLMGESIIEGVAIGLIPICIGIGQLITVKIEKKNNNHLDTTKSE